MTIPNKPTSIANQEKEILDFWNNHDIFQKTLQKNKNKPTFVFYEGPPTANGQPGLHHVLARSFKDIICRYKTMQGYHVPRQAGWDTHGLPVEIQVEKELGLKSKKDIENIIPGNHRDSLKEFNKKCQESVWRYQDLWEKLTKRMGYWLDMDNPYITYQPEYIESLWWIISEIHKKDLLYQGYKILPWCPRCGTGLSSHEVAQGYKSTVDTSLYVKFKLKPGQIIKNKVINNNTCILSWTTTPWTLPGNVALAVGQDIKYAAITIKNETYILAQNLIDPILGKEYKKKINFLTTGNDLVNLEYKPLFDIKHLKSENSYKIYPANFVTTTDGTGIVHTAVMYGEDDYKLGLSLNLPTVHTVNEDGYFFDYVPIVKNLKAKDKNTEEKIISYLKKNNNLLKTQDYKHDYPFCWRCDTPLLYYARSSWFIKMSQLKSKLKANNQQVNWIPSHLKKGRFGQWLNEIKDWSISRERYWATPLPIWQCDSCHHTEVISSLEDLANKAISNQNQFYLLRHGEATSNVKKFYSCYPEKVKNCLTQKGRSSILKTAQKLSNKKIDLIFTSDLNRAQETANLIASKLNIKKIIIDQRLREVDFGEYNNYPIAKNIPWSDFNEKPNQIRQRVMSFFLSINKKYKNKNILIISHDAPLKILSLATLGQKLIKQNLSSSYLKTGCFKKLSFKPYPFNDQGELDLHRPYIDNLQLLCPCGKPMSRIKEVADVWFDSGAMPFASKHYPHANKKLIDNYKLFPADYISEAIDQTRGWFYTLLAVSTLLDKGPAYKNVISLGHINDKLGKKMSKSKGNIVDASAIMDKYGADTVRWHFFTVNSPGDPKNFDEQDLKKVRQNVFNIFSNILTYFITYADKSALNKKISLSHPLDKWLSSRTAETITDVTNSLNNYNPLSAAKKIEDLINDTSRWYIRRSRSRFQGQTTKMDLKAASQILFYTLINLTKITAPFSPFISESIYQRLKVYLPKKEQLDSIHLANWPTPLKINQKIISHMNKIRLYSSLGLAERAALGIKTRQPLSELIIKSSQNSLSNSILNILKDEVNVRSVKFTKVLPGNKKVTLNAVITPALQAEGDLREFTRLLQSLRGKANLNPGELVNLYIQTDNQILLNLIKRNQKTIKKIASIKSISFSSAQKPLLSETINFDRFGQITIYLQ